MATLRWYHRNHAVWLGALPILLATVLLALPSKLPLLVLSWIASYGGVLLGLLLVGGGVAGLGAWIAQRRATVRLRNTGMGLVCWALGLAVWVAVQQYAAYAQVAVTIPAPDARLAATLYLPDAPKAGLVLIHGSPDFDRGFYHVWADFFAREGIAVLSYDKRGTGASEGVFVSDNNTAPANLERLASDVVAALHTLKQQPGLEGQPMGVFGISQAGWIVPLVADRFPLAFSILASGPTCTTGEEAVYSQLRGDDTDAATATRAEAEQAVLEAGPSGFDPVPLLATMSSPGLWLFGAHDDSIPVQRSAALLDTLMAAGQPFTYHILSGADHLLVTRGGIPDFHPAFWTTMTAWLRAHEIL